MRNYLEREDDGLPMRPSGTWAVEKLDYLARYINVFETSMRQKWPVRYYVDLLAGPGKNRVRDTGTILLGSPLVALTTAHPFTGYFFVDLCEGNTTALRQRCTASPLYNQVDIRTGDCNDLIDGIIAHIRRNDWHALNLAFLDPEGLELQWETVAKLASVRRMDLIINYPQLGLNHNMYQAFETEGQTAVDLFFGDRGWRQIYEEWQTKKGHFGIHRRLMDYYKKKLQDLGYKEVLRDDEVDDEPLIRNAKRNAPLYRLLFASKHPLGHEFWQKVTRRDVYGQSHLF
jgi:three-Cys-motif partner protein